MNNYKIFYKNEKELDLTYKSIFKGGEYKFESRRKKLFIIDCGSHIGISILYFKHFCLGSKILGFEPDPQNFQVLRKNIKVNGLKKVVILNKALSDTRGKRPFYINNRWGWEGSLLKSSRNPYKISVAVDKLSRYINEPVDLVKIDIEGSEEKVLADIKSKFKFIKCIILEYHSGEYRKNNNFYRIREILEKGGYKLKYSSGNYRFSFLNNIWKYILPIRGGIIRAVRNGREDS